MNTYREPAAERSPLPQRRVLGDDLVVALMLLLVGRAGIAIGSSADRATELSFGVIRIGLAAKVAWDAFHSA